MKKAFIAILIVFILTSCQAFGQANKPPSTYGYFFLPASSVYVADDRTLAVMSADCIFTKTVCEAPVVVPTFETNFYKLIWSRDNSQAIASTKMDSGENLFLFSGDDYTLKPLFKMAYIDSIAWSQDGKQIAVAGVKDGNVDSASTTDGQIERSRIFLVAIDIENIRELTTELRGAKQDVNWLDTEHVIFENYPLEETHGIYKVNVMSGESIRLIDSYSFNPIPSPKGDKIAFFQVGTPGENKTSINIMKADGSSKKIFAEVSGDVLNAYWIEDDTIILHIFDAKTSNDGIYAIFHPENKEIKIIYNESKHAFAWPISTQNGWYLLTTIRNDQTGFIEKWLLISIPDGKAQEIKIPGYEKEQPGWISWQSINN